MQSILRFTWCDQIAPKMQTGKSALESMRASPVMDMPVLNKLKRRRMDSPEPQSPTRAQPVKKQRIQEPACGQHSLPAVATARLPAKSEKEYLATAAPAVDDVACQTTTPPEPSKAQTTSMSNDISMTDAYLMVPATVQLSKLQQVIENEFNMQILLKHNELRLIEQELAKCQIALEQLRRCELRPYPGAETPSQSITHGTGPSLAPPAGYAQALYAAPHGVTDGPYTRHYRQWLLQDQLFDTTPLQSPAFVIDASHTAARSTRNTGTSRKSIQKSATLPSRASDPMQSLPNYPPAPKDKAAPMILRRSTDGRLVKLICNNCLRGNFSSIQGFLNHCRIAHKVDYKSHDAAAVDCGRVLNEEEAANLPPEAQAAVTVHKPGGSRSASTTSTPFKTQHLIHPLNLAQNAATLISPQVRDVRQPAPVAPMVFLPPTPGRPKPFTGSPQAPRLSAFFAKYNLGGDLEQAISAAKQKVDMSAEEVLSPQEIDSASPSTPAVTGSRSGLGVPRAGSLAPAGAHSRPQSRTGHREPAQRHRPSPLMPAPPKAHKTARTAHDEVPESPQDRSSYLSPHSHTADSNPGLVSDHDDDEHGSASEDEAPHSSVAHSLGPTRRDCTDSMDIDVTVDDDIDEHGVVIRRNSLLGPVDRGSRTTGSPSTRFGIGKDSA
ncbi:hypothetical protein BAUCODRAFT_88692 [Baudoinia panamericana UAMH 10762]|uniref:AHC1-like C2H2 zinc-finger domain-containing protein n=1 Tax=Baudoinia panamericana (strain UAMH 10762) TaxID=717646 RepID=M2MLW4_BAUPA|nr:uncharacterized protein BAUCODRAFT_88692 [Baudoinia panamericana UAMH 10762]EMC97661.1 hypothetical protein BAUCODRAFT_88692 [Baudoinia panamericana UAMH 10762]